MVSDKHLILYVSRAITLHGVSLNDFL